MIIYKFGSKLETQATGWHERLHRDVPKCQALMPETAVCTANPSFFQLRSVLFDHDHDLSFAFTKQRVAKPNPNHDGDRLHTHAFLVIQHILHTLIPLFAYFWGFLKCFFMHDLGY